MRKTKTVKRHGRRPDTDCAICGHPCDTWQDCVTFQKLRGPYNHSLYTMIYDTGQPYTPAEVEERLATFRTRFPWMLKDEIEIASILEGSSHVCAKAGGSAGSGQYSKYLRNCEACARKRGIVFDTHMQVVPPTDDDLGNVDFY